MYTKVLFSQKVSKQKSTFILPSLMSPRKKGELPNTNKSDGPFKALQVHTWHHQRTHIKATKWALIRHLKVIYKVPLGSLKDNS
jgi:hypothetical protein